MRMDDFLAISHWAEGGGEDADTVLSSRVRLARNLEGIPFPGRMSDPEGERVLREVEESLDRLEGTWHLFHMAQLTSLDRQAMVEQHLISPQHAREPENKGVALRRDGVVSVMVNEEDHLRIQCLLAGLELERAWQTATAVDDTLEEQLDYAFDPRLGYLTACPTNVGTGIRASVMMHLPALTMTNQASEVFGALAKLGLAVRGLYGEGTEVLGNLFQISNQITLGLGEEEIIHNLQGVTRQIIDHERAARELLLRENRLSLEDRVGRAYGILANARVTTSDEAMRLISDVRLGVDLGMITGVPPQTINELLVLTRVASLQKAAGQTLNPFERDVRRAALIRERLAAPTQGGKEDVR
ncbi:MAG: protein arginine kinase [Thermaerobacter sp.]|nr:protein arginine kinase [Thermaerobacter sp.]